MAEKPDAEGRGVESKAKAANREESIAHVSEMYGTPSNGRASLRTMLEEAERLEILSALEQANWVVAGPRGAAARLGMKRSTLQFRMHRLGISPPPKKGEPC